MGKFSLKKGDNDEDSGRLALFGSRSKSKSPAPPSNNPYAQPAIPPDPYTQAKMSAGIVPPQGEARPGSNPRAGYRPGPGPQGSYSGLPGPGQQRPSHGGGNPYAGNQPSNYGDNKTGPPQGGYGGSGGGYGPEKFGNQNGYGGAANGGNPYASIQQTSGTSREGGYGGLGSSSLYENDSSRDELFGGAQQRMQQKQPQPGGPPDYQYNNANEGGDRSFGAYGDRQLTAEEEEEEDIQATKQEIKFMKQQDVASTRNALRVAAQAEEMGRNTLARLGAQGERMHNTDRNLDIGNNHINIAEDKTKELKTLNRSMFAVHVNNPFTAKERRTRRDEQIMDRHHAEREAREATREAAFRSTQRMNQNFKGLEDTPGGPQAKQSLAERAKYQFEADSEDDAMEGEIDRNLDDLTGAARRLNLLARATGEEVEQQNQLIQNIAEKVSVSHIATLALANHAAERPLRRSPTLPNRTIEENSIGIAVRSFKCTPTWKPLAPEDHWHERQNLVVSC